MTRTVIESKTKTVVIGFDEPFCVIGERINPTGRKKLAAELEAGNFDTVIKDALGFDAGIGWVAPEVLDADGIARLRTQLLHLPQPWAMDWSALIAIDVQAAAELVRLMHDWGDQSLDIRWIGGSRLLQVLSDVAPAGVRDVDPAYWMLRLEALRLANRPNEFDQTALDYCMTFEVSPPSWAPVQCSVKLVNPSGVTEAGDLPPPEHSPDRFIESLPYQDAHNDQADVELNGQLVGDIDALLKRMTAQTVGSERIHVSCARLIRMDFLAAGDVLNWVISRRNEGRSVTFTDTHRLVALFCGAMGISEHARVATRRH